MPERFNTELLDLDDPFEIDRGNRPHLAQRFPYGEEDVYDVWGGDPVFFEYTGEGSSHWLMVGEIPGGTVLVVPLAPSNSGDPSKARPVTLFEADQSIIRRYYAERR